MRIQAVRLPGIGDAQYGLRRCVGDAERGY